MSCFQLMFTRKRVPAAIDDAAGIALAEKDLAWERENPRISAVRASPWVQVTNKEEWQGPETLSDAIINTLQLQLAFNIAKIYRKVNMRRTVAAAIKNVNKATENTDACFLSLAMTFDGGNKGPGCSVNPSA